MTQPPPPANDDERLQALQRSGVLADAPLEALRAIAAKAAAGADAPVALVTFIDAESAWIKAGFGMPEGEVDRHSAFCAWAIHSLEVLWIEDTLLDARYSDNPLVLTEPFIRHYAGVPITTPDGYALGALCVMDYRPRVMEEATRRRLEALAGEVEAALFPSSTRATPP